MNSAKSQDWKTSFLLNMLLYHVVTLNVKKKIQIKGFVVQCQLI